MTEKREIEVTYYGDGEEGGTIYKINDLITLELHCTHAGFKWWFTLQDGNDEYYCISEEEYDELLEFRKTKLEKKLKEPKNYLKHHYTL